MFLKGFSGIFVKMYYLIFLYEVITLYFGVFLLLTIMVSALAIIRLFCSSILFFFRLYCYLLRNMLFVFVSMIYLIFLVGRYPKVFCIFVSRFLIAFLCLSLTYSMEQSPS